MITILIIVLAIIFLFIVSLIVYFVGIYNGLVQLRVAVDKAWANIDVLLKQRHDELPKLIETCKGYMKYEQETLSKLTELRTLWAKATTVAEKTATSNMISDALKTIFAVAENYPDLKANSTFQHLQTRISGLENEIADRREFYNESVNNFNTRIQQIPDVIIARMLNYQPQVFWRASEEEKKDVTVKF